MKKTISFLFLAAFIFKASVTEAQINAQDSLALVDIYNNDNGVNWPSYAQWALNTPVVSGIWYGVTVTNGRVTALDYPGGGKMKGPIPASIGNLTALTDLVMDDSLSGSIPASMGNLVNLNRLSVQINQLTGSIPASLGNLVNLTVLLLDDNKLTGSIPASLGNLTKIEDLSFAENQLSDSVPSTLDNFNPADIQLLDYSGNEFTFSGLEGIATAYAGTNTGIDGQAKIPLHLNGSLFSVSAGGTLSNNTYVWTMTSPKYQVLATNVGDSTFTATANGTYSVTVSNAICSPAPFSLTLTSDTLSISTLPIDLLNFTASLIKNDVLLAWKTSTEINSSYFNVQRSVDGKNFSSTGRINAAGNSASAKNYSYIDENVTALNVPVVYYRLQEVDKDGATSYSKIATISLAGHNALIAVIPNPAQDYMTISGVTGYTAVQVVDMNGKTVKQFTNTQTNTFNIQDLVPGMYIVRLITNTGVQTLKMEKQ